MNAPATVAASDVDDHGAAVVGVVQIGALKVALRVAEIREVVPCPERLEAAPGVADVIAGTMRLRGAIIPIIDLSGYLDRGRAAIKTAATSVLIIRVGGKLLGVLANGIVGVRRVDAHRVRSVCFDPAEPLGAIVTGSFDAEDSAIFMLSGEALAALPNVWTTIEHDETRLERSNCTTSLMFRVGEFSFAMPSLSVAAVLPNPAVAPGPCTIEGWLGFVRYLGTNVPIADARFCLGIGSVHGQSDAAVALIFDAGPNARIALAIDKVCDLQRISLDGLLPMPPLVSLRPELFSGVHSGSDDTQYYVIDGPRFLASDHITALAEACRTDAGTSDRSRQGADGGASDVTPHMLFELNGLHAVPLRQVAHVVEYPDKLRALPDRADWLIGEFAHRGRSRPLIDLAQLLGHPPLKPGTEARILVVNLVEGASVGLAVAQLHSVVSGRRAIIGRAGVPVVPKAGNRVPDAVLSLVGEGRKAHYPIIDFEDLVAEYLSSHV